MSVVLAGRPDRDGRVFRSCRLAALYGITVTGIVYSTVLARVHQPQGAAETLVNDLVHYVIPVMMVVGWVALGPRPRIDWLSFFWSLGFPVAWFAYTLVRGSIWKWYPYPFVDVTVEGYPRVLVNAILVSLVLGAVAALFAIGDRRLAPAPSRRASEQISAPATS